MPAISVDPLEILHKGWYHCRNESPYTAFNKQHTFSVDFSKDSSQLKVQYVISKIENLFAHWLQVNVCGS